MKFSMRDQHQDKCAIQSFHGTGFFACKEMFAWSSFFPLLVVLCCVALLCFALRCVALRCVELSCVELRCVALSSVELRCIALRCTGVLCVLACVHTHIRACVCRGYLIIFRDSSSFVSDLVVGSWIVSFCFFSFFFCFFRLYFMFPRFLPATILYLMFVVTVDDRRWR